jgi:hypothetical protein
MCVFAIFNLFLIFRLRQPEPVKEALPSTAPAFTPEPVATSEK